MTSRCGNKVVVGVIGGEGGEGNKGKRKKKVISIGG